VRRALSFLRGGRFLRSPVKTIRSILPGQVGILLLMNDKAQPKTPQAATASEFQERIASHEEKLGWVREYL
jgi:hypothetical protein